MSKGRILRKGQGQVTERSPYTNIQINRVTHVLWSVFDVELKNDVYFNI